MTKVSKQQRKYGKTEITEKETEYEKKFKVLIDGSSFLPKHWDTYEEAELAAMDFCKNRTCKYLVVGGVNVAKRPSKSTRDN